MSKSCGGGGLKGHDKGGGGGVKVVKKNASLEAALEKVQDAFLCPGGHRMKLHNGSRREGNLTCDGPEDICCGRDGDGVLRPGEPRYTCEQCDFDICERCCEAETAPEMTPEEKRQALKQKLREMSGRAKPKDEVSLGGSDDAAKAAKRAEQEALERKRAEIAAKVAAAKEAAAAALSAPAGDAALSAAIASNDLEELKACIQREAEAGTASADALAAARKARDKLKAKARKAAQKESKSEGEAKAEQASAEVATEEVASPEAPDSPTEGLATPAKAASNAAPESPAEAAVSPAAQAPAAAFSFNWSLSTPTAKSAGDESDDSSSDDDGEDEEEEEARSAPARGVDVSVDGVDFPLGPPGHPLVCPFTQQVMEDPVVLADGYTYERKAVEKYLEKHDRSPRTGEKLASKALLPNLMARELCTAARSLEL